MKEIGKVEIKQVFGGMVGGVKRPLPGMPDPQPMPNPQFPPIPQPYPGPVGPIVWGD